jgi:hypothetical protein
MSGHAEFFPYPYAKEWQGRDYKKSGKARDGRALRMHARPECQTKRSSEPRGETRCLVPSNIDSSTL